MRPLLLVLLAALVSAGYQATAPGPGSSRHADTEAVGRRGANRTVLPVNQIVTPLGVQVELPGLRPQALALSPDGRLLITSGKSSELVIVDPATGAIRQRVTLPKTPADQPPPSAPSANVLEPDKEGQLSYTGLRFSPDGRRAFLSDVNGSVVVFDVAADGRVSVSHTIRLPDANAPRREEEIPAGLAVSADGARLYVCGNLSNTLLEVDVADGRVRRVFDVGVAPYDVVLTGGKAYVSNWGGRRPLPGQLTGPAGRGTEVKVDPVKHVASEGSVTVIDIASGKPLAEIVTGLHASALAVSPDGRHVVCANAASDTLSVIDTQTGAVVETIWTKPSPADLFGAQPNALAFDPSGRTLYVANGTQNAVAVVAFDPRDRESKLQGLIPVGWFPGALVFDAPRRTLHVANIKGHPANPKPDKTGREAPPGVAGFNSHHYHGSLSLVPVPEARDLAKLSETVWQNLRRDRIAEARLPPRPGQPARAVPERIGEPSLVKHVVYVIKENRTYDQVLGDVAAGNGDPRLCIFGAQITPNQHKLVRDFVLLDNTYCAGILSADGHQWSTTAIGTDYLERSFAGWPRSYPDGMGEDENDALAYSPAGFLWDNALRHGVRIRNYGEFMAPAVKWRGPGKKGTPDFLANYRTWKGESDEAVFASEPMIETIRPFSPTAYVGWEMAVPDQFRADFILAELQEFVGPGQVPAAHDHLPAQRPHERHEPRLPHPGRDRGRQRPRAGAHRRGPEPLALLAGDGDLRHRGRPAGRLGPRERLPHHGLRGEPLRETRRGREHPVQHHEPRAHPRADPRPAADEPARRERRPDVGRLHGCARLHALRRGAQQRPPRPDEPGRPGPRGPGGPAGRRRLRADEFPRGGQGPGGRAQPDPLAGDEGLARAVPGVGRHRGRRR